MTVATELPRLRVKACGNCGGDLFLEVDPDTREYYYNCLQCSHSVTTGVKRSTPKGYLNVKVNSNFPVGAFGLSKRDDYLNSQGFSQTFFQ